MVHLQCVYKFEDKEPLPQLSVQWKDPSSRLVCQHIKHKQFQWCSDGYDLSYRPANITLTIQRVQDQDFGVHVCSVNKLHDFDDHRMEVVRTTGEFHSSGGGASVVQLTEDVRNWICDCLFSKIWNLLHLRHQTLGGSCQVGRAGLLALASLKARKGQLQIVCLFIIQINRQTSIVIIYSKKYSYDNDLYNDNKY